MKFSTYVLFFLLFGVVADVTLGLTLLRDAPLWGKLVMAFPTLVALVCLPLMAMGKVYTDAVSAFFLTYIFYVSRRLIVKEYKLEFEDLPAGFDGLRICHISDLHLGSIGHKSKLVWRIVDRVQALRPEIILFTGDLVSYESREADAYRPALEPRFKE